MANTLKILVCTDPEQSDSIHVYAAKCTNDSIYDVETAFENLDIRVSESDVERIASTLDKGKPAWFHETLCFEVIEIADSMSNEASFSVYDYSRRHTRINPTGKPTKYWLAVEENSPQLNNDSHFIDLGNLQMVVIEKNNIPSSTQDKLKIWEIAHRVIRKYPNMYVFIGQDKYSHGMQTGLDHLRASVLTWWSPKYKMWSTIPDDVIRKS